jgi:hypothetical protein
MRPASRALLKRVIVALVAGLLAVSCTWDSPEEETPSHFPLALPVKAERPVEKIATNVDMQCPDYAEGCPMAMIGGTPTPRRTKAFLARLGKPSWYRYIQAVQVTDDWGIAGPRRGYGAIVQTGVVADKMGRKVGATICRAMLREEVKYATVLARVERESFPEPLATCS